MLSQQTIGIGYTLLSGVGVVILPTTAKLAYNSGSDTITVAFSRGVVATLILLLTVLALKQAIKLPRHLLGASFVAGISGVCFVYGMYHAIAYINISLAVLILYLYPIVLAIYEHFRGRTLLRGIHWLCCLFACIGLSLILGVEFDNISLIGVVFAVIAMLASVVITLSNMPVAKATGSLVSNLYMSLWGAIIFALILFVFGEFKSPGSSLGWAALGTNGVAYCISWVAFFSGARILGVTRASMITLIDPPMAALFAWLIFNESFTLPQWAGFVIVLIALTVFELQTRVSSTSDQ